jgi:hypothetical protein
LKTAEDECIARLKISARSLGLECLEVDSFARLVAPPHVQLTQDDVDFVISLHFETPKRYDIFSFVALWNPVQFFHEWGYRKFTRNLLTHDDFLSCSSHWADDQVERLVASDPMREGPEFRLYHSLSEPIFPPTTGDGKLFYAGINWERLGKKPQRHGGLLKLLDETGDMRIYGPKLFNGVDVWAGFRSYQGSIPFDGVSMVRAINKAGVSLVLSSEAHRQSELMSSRLFESLAAGAVIICDENPFAHQFFGKTLLYIDSTLSVEETYGQVQSHLDWIRSYPAAAQELAKQAQEIFLRDFALDHCLQKIYAGFPGRKRRLECLYTPKRPQEKVSVIFLMPEYSSEVLERHIASCLAQKAVAIRPILAMDDRDFALFGHRVQTRLNEASVPITVATLDFFDRYPTGMVRSRRRSGSILHRIIEDFTEEEYFCIAGPHERLFSDHLCSLLRTLQDNEDIGSAWADVLLLHKTDGVEHADMNQDPDSHDSSDDQRIGLGRFLFRKSALPKNLDTVLPYLDAFPMTLLFGITKSLPAKRCTLVMDISDGFHDHNVTSARPHEEREVLIDYAPSAFARMRSDHVQQSSLSLESMTHEQKTKLAVELAHSVPFPAFVKKIGFGAYRLWLRRSKASS